MINKGGVTGLKSMLAIDKNALDEACLRQSSLYGTVAEAYATARSLYDAAKLNVTVQTAVATEELRSIGEKKAETRLKIEAAAHHLVVAAEQTMIKCKLDMGMYEALKDAYAQRASMLKVLCELYKGEYFGNIEIKSNAIKERSNNAKREQVKNSRRVRKDVK